MNSELLIKNVIKVSASLALIASFALVFTVLSTDADVASVSADVTDLVPQEVTEHGDFSRVIDNSGLESRPYNMSGNLTHFAAGHSPLSPLELGDHFQQSLVRSGINSKIYDDGYSDLQHYLHREIITAKKRDYQDDDFDAQAHKPEDFDARTEDLRYQTQAMLNGEVVPLHMSDERVTMAGIEPHRQVDDLDDIEHQWLRDPINNEVSLDQNMDNFRFIEAYRSEGDQYTTVNAAWGEDGQFDTEKMSDLSSLDQDPDVELPPCPGCERVQRLEGLHHEEPYTLNQFRAHTSADNVLDYYTRALSERGWEISERDNILSELAQHVPEVHGHTQGAQTFQRGEEYISLRAIASDAQTTHVVTMHGEMVE